VAGLCHILRGDFYQITAMQCQPQEEEEEEASWRQLFLWSSTSS